MTQVVPPQTQFNSGELSPKLLGRSDLQWYGNGCVVLENMIPVPHGPAMTRPGTIHLGVPRVVGAPNDGAVKLVQFVFSDSIVYVVEATHQKFRFWSVRDRALILNPSLPFELATPYAVADLPLLRRVQSADVVYLLHGSYPTQKLRRLTSTTFDLTEVSFQDGPYLATNVTATTLTPASTSGNGVTLTASTALFAATDVGRLVRILHSSTWGYAKIVGFDSATSVTIDIKVAFAATSASVSWRLGVFSATSGYPVCAAFHEERLGLGSNPTGSFPRVDLTKTGDFENFTPGSLADDPIDFVIAGDDVPRMRDLISDRSLIALTSSTEFKLGSETSNDPLSPENPPKVVEISREGTSAGGSAVKAKRGILFPQLHAKAWIELAYAVDADGLRPRELTVRSDHIGERERFAGGTWANRPWNVLWMWGVRGSLSGMSYAPEQEVIALHRHKLGGRFGRRGAPVVESAVAVPGPEGDELWMSVKRTVNNTTSREICVMAYELRDNQPADEAIYLDSSLTVRGTAPAADLVLSAVDLEAGTATATASADVFVAGDVGRRIVATLEAGLDDHGLIAWRQFVVDIVAYSTARIVSLELVSSYVPPDLALYNGEWRFALTEITTAQHLEGETVEMLGDGAPMAAQVVSNGRLVVDPPAAIVTFGLDYLSILQPMRPDAGARMGSSGSRQMRTVSVGIRLLRSGPFKVGTPSQTYEFPQRTPDMPTDEPVPLFTGDAAPIAVGGTTSRNSFWRLERRGPLPVTVNAAYPIEEVSEGVP